MAITARTTQIHEICDILAHLIKNPKSLGLRERLPPRVLAALTSTREILQEEMNGKNSLGVGENDLAAELSQDADRQHGIPEEEQNKMSFNQLLCRRMQQLHLSNHDVAVNLGCSIQHVCELTTGVTAPTELHLAELAVLLRMTQESLATAAKPELRVPAATV